MYKCKKFSLKELVSKDVYNRFGEKAWEFFDDRILMTADQLREKFGKAIINDWEWGGKFDSRGFRAPSDKDGAEFSAHRRGQALDMVFAKVTAAEIRRYILEHPQEFPYINALEKDVSWLHIDTRNCVRIKSFKG